MSPVTIRANPTKLQLVKYFASKHKILVLVHSNESDTNLCPILIRPHHKFHAMSSKSSRKEPEKKCGAEIPACTHTCRGIWQVSKPKLYKTCALLGFAIVPHRSPSLDKSRCSLSLDAESLTPASCHSDTYVSLPSYPSFQLSIERNELAGWRYPYGGPSREEDLKASLLVLWFYRNAFGDLSVIPRTWWSYVYSAIRWDNCGM